MVTLKQKRLINAHELAMFKAFQKKFFKSETIPELDDVKLFLAWNGIYSHENLSMLIKWKNTRYKREFLTDAQIGEWFEFYYN